MQIRTGIDIVEIRRIKQLIEKSGDRFLSKHFTSAEIEYCSKKSVSRFAGCFAAKEATYKALRLNWNRGFSWKNIEVVHDRQGKPEIQLHNSVKDHYLEQSYTDIGVSISYAGEYAAASVIAVQLQH